MPFFHPPRLNHLHPYHTMHPISIYTFLIYYIHTTTVYQLVMVASGLRFERAACSAGTTRMVPAHPASTRVKVNCLATAVSLATGQTCAEVPDVWHVRSMQGVAFCVCKRRPGYTCQPPYQANPLPCSSYHWVQVNKSP